MTLERLIEDIQAEWEPERGFFWSIREGHFEAKEYARVLKAVSSVPEMVGPSVPIRLVQVLWYVPLFMQWQVERVKESGGDLLEYNRAVSALTTEVERILGVP